MSGGQDWANEQLAGNTPEGQAILILSKRVEELRDRIAPLEKIEAAAKEYIAVQDRAFMSLGLRAAFDALKYAVYRDTLAPKPTPPPKPEFTRLFRYTSGEMRWAGANGFDIQGRHLPSFDWTEIDPTTMEPLR